MWRNARDVNRSKKRFLSRFPTVIFSAVLARVKCGGFWVILEKNLRVHQLDRSSSLLKSHYSHLTEPRLVATNTPTHLCSHKHMDMR